MADAGFDGVMTNTLKMTFGATTAIAAALALTSTPALAQDASTSTLDGPIVNPVAAEPAPATTTQTATDPVIILPATTQTATPTASTTGPVVQQVPEPTAEAPSTTSANAPAAVTKTAPAAAAPVARSSAAPREATPAPAQETSIEAAPEETIAPVAPAPLAQSGFTPADELSPPAAEPTPEQAQDATAILALVLAGLIALVVAALVMFAVRRRVSTAEKRRTAIARDTSAAPVVAPVRTARTNEASRPLFVEPKRPATAAGAAMLRSNGASVPLPSQLPETFEERDALIKRMVAAEPDRANPFVAPKARLRRARLILQSLGRKFERAEPWIDLSQYPQNWPTLAKAGQVTGSSPAARAESRILEPA